MIGDTATRLRSLATRLKGGQYDEKDIMEAWIALREFAKYQWQPIETAPKDGTHVILFWDGEVLSGHWWPYGPVQFGAKGNWTKDRFGLGVTPHWSAPTHWMPLPPTHNIQPETTEGAP